jgi:predicted RNA-binding protein YlqC (UPF0109 family)
MPERTRESEDEAICRLVAEVAKALVDATDDVRVELLEGTDATTVRLYVADADVGKLIGKHGHTARSFRTILSAASMKYKRRYALDIAHAEPSWNEPHTGHD